MDIYTHTIWRRNQTITKMTQYSLYCQMFLVFSMIHPPVVSFTLITSDSVEPSLMAHQHWLMPQTGFPMTNDGARTEPDERDAVYDIMRATGNDWDAAIPDVCRGRWHGIECMLDQDDVYHLASLSFGSFSVDTASPSPSLGLNTLRPCSSTDVWAGLQIGYPRF